MYLHWLLGRVVLLGDAVDRVDDLVVWGLLGWRVRVVCVHVVGVVSIRHCFSNKSGLKVLLTNKKIFNINY